MLRALSGLRPWSIVVMISCLVASTDGCRAGSQAQRLQWSRDSATYQTELSRWRHDSLVIDSLGRLVPMDSLYRLRRTMLTSPNPVDYVPLIICARSELRWRYGSRPYEVAQKRMDDTLWKKGEDAALRAMWDRVPRSGAVSIDMEKCGSRRSSEHAPDSVSGVSLEVEPLRPLPPKRP